MARSIGIEEMGALNSLSASAHATARERGWYDEGQAPSFIEQLALIHAEVSEALERYRNGEAIAAFSWKYAGPLPLVGWKWVDGDVLMYRTYDSEDAGYDPVRDGPAWKPATPEIARRAGFRVVPDGIPTELADIAIRLFDVCGNHGVDLDQAVAAKMEFNKSRGFRHGGKLA